MNKNNKEADYQYSHMVNDHVGLLIVTNAIPTMTNMVMAAFYNAVDTFFVAQLGTTQAGAVGIVLSMMSLITALGNTFGMGSCTIISRALGKQDREKAESIANSGMARRADDECSDTYAGRVCHPTDNAVAWLHGNDFALFGGLWADYHDVGADYDDGLLFSVFTEGGRKGEKFPACDHIGRFFEYRDKSYFHFHVKTGSQRSRHCDGIKSDGHAGHARLDLSS